MIIASLLCLLLLCNNVALAQVIGNKNTIVPIDTTVNKEHSAHKATLYSMALPGLGQAYNKKYWKIPVIYAGFGVLAYNIHVNAKEMNKFTDAYRYIIRGDTSYTDNEYVTKYPDVNNLLKGRDYYRRRVELSVILTTVWYIFNVVDAAVDAHFFDYDVSENLSLNIQPIIIRDPKSPQATGGIKLTMNF